MWSDYLPKHITVFCGGEGEKFQNQRQINIAQGHMERGQQESSDSKYLFK